MLGALAYVTVRFVYDAELERSGRIAAPADRAAWLVETVTIHLPGFAVWLGVLCVIALVVRGVQRRSAERLATQARRQGALSRIALTADVTDETQRDILARCVEAAASGLPASGASIVLWDAGRQEFVVGATTASAASGDDPARLVRREGGATRWIVEHRQPLMVADTDRDPFAPNAMLAERGFRAYVGVPVLFRAEAIGVLYALQRRPTAATDDDVAFLREVARRAAVAISRDRLLADLRRANEQLEELSGRTRSILSSTVEGVCGLDEAGCFTFVNPAAARLLGYGEPELIGRHAHSTIHHRRRDGSHYRAADCPMRRTFETGEPVVRDDEVLWRRDGTPLEVEWSATGIVEGGRVAGAVLTFRDIAQRKAVERMKDEFVSVASHELRTPLTSIRGALGLIEGGVYGALPPGADAMIATALRNTERLGRLVNDLLDLDRMRAGQIALAVHEADIANVARQAIDAMRPMAQAAGVRLDSETPSCVVAIDAERIVQVLVNLLSNAIKFSPAGSTVRVESEAAVGELRVSVADQGRGIPAAQLDAVFERFHQVQRADSREIGGTGLGLAICREIVVQHGGRIWVESEIGRGSTFIVALPRPAR